MAYRGQIPPKKSLGIFSGLRTVLDTQQERKQTLEDRLAQKEMRGLQTRTLEQSLAEGRARLDALTAPKLPKIIGQKEDPVTGEVHNLYDDGTAKPVSVAGTARPPVGHEADDEMHGQPAQQVPTPAPSTLKLGRKPEPAKAKRTQLVKNRSGVMVAVDLDTGLGLDGKPVAAWQEPQSGGDGRPPTEGERKASGFASRVVPAGQRVNQFDNSKTLDVIAEKAGMLGNWAKSAEGRQLRTAGLTWAYAVLRPESGATITDDELDGYFEAYLPRPGDDPVTLAMKRQARREAEESIATMAGRALPKGAMTSAIQADSAAAANRGGAPASPLNPLIPAGTTQTLDPSAWLTARRTGGRPPR
jgi:hypothetical protein